MSSNMNNKNRMYNFEKIALVIAAVITVAIILLVVLGTRGSGRKKADPSSVIDETSDISGDISADENSFVPYPHAEEFTTVKIDNSKLNDGPLVLVNQDHKYLANIDDQLVNLYSYNQSDGKTGSDWYGLVDVSQQLRGEVADALNAMYRDYYAALQSSDVVVTRTYVDSQTQQKEYDAEVQTAQPDEKPYLQAGGYSEHQTGYAFNLRVSETALSWFNDNCWKYGFIVRYPQGKESVTYVKGEPNHFRFVGVPHALYMKTQKLTLEEYLGLLETKTSDSRLKLDNGTSDKMETYMCKAQNGAETEIKVPAESSGWTYTVSGTNNGYFVVTIYKIEE